MAKHKEVAISVKDLHKSFKLPHEQHSGIKQAIINVFRKDKKRGYEIQHVLKGLDFEIEKGDFFGIVGRNGSGKSTLLKTLAGIYSPDKGEVQVSGTLVPFIELGVGFNPELTGRENVFLNGALLGFSRDEMDAMYVDIVEFAELEKFMDQKLKNYSSGMQVRLAFSIAIRADGDILLLDEVLAVGDEAFQRKCYSYFAELKKNKKTVILVTHSMESVQQFCNKAMMVEDGSIVGLGSPGEIARKYSELFLTSTTKTDDGEEKVQIAQNSEFEISTKFHKTKDKISLDFSITPNKNFEDPVVGIYIDRDNGETIWKWASDYKIKANNNINVSIQKNNTQHIRIDLDNILPSGGYSATLLIRRGDRSEYYARYHDIIHFDTYTASQYDKLWKMREQVKASRSEV
ncbi:TPA: phosphate/phosphonate ABC transporter ATP-binding protein [Candidatus Saccharibacteria bacterium]|nr:phosphate/phosphonate ABC transporter ATP-binding protein [Candidatus Saccharibacteria bacterium]